MRKPSAAIRGRLETAKAQDWRHKRFKKQAGLCAYCVIPMVLEPENSKRSATLDHVIPRSRGGDHHWENVVCACLTCNREKGDLTSDEYLALRISLGKTTNPHEGG